MRPVLLAVTFALFLGGAPAHSDEPSPRDAELPPGWSVSKRLDLPTSTTKAIAQRLGASITTISNDVWSLNGFNAQVNTIVATDEDAAKACLGTLEQLGRAGFVKRRGVYVVEVAGSNALVADRVFAALGLEPDAITTWSVEVRIGLVDELDYMTANPVFNHFLALERGEGEGAEAAIRELSKGWKMGNTKDLLTEKQPWFEAAYRFEPSTTAGTRGGETTAFAFEDPPRRFGIPYADLTATVKVKSRFAPVEVEGDSGSTAATPFWPADDPQIRALAQAITKDAKTGRERVLALLRYAWGEVKYGGEVGSRYGVRQTLDQGHGHCWDKSDLLVTLCRASGIPAREVAGWVPAMKSGHVWTEVRIPGEGWIPVDATTSWLGISAGYVPLYRTDDGRMPIVYLAWPAVERK